MRLPPRLAKRRSSPLAPLAGSRRGATAVEYGLIAALIVIAMIASFKGVANVTVGMWGNVNTRIGTATGN